MLRSFGIHAEDDFVRAMILSHLSLPARRPLLRPETPGASKLARGMVA